MDFVIGLPRNPKGNNTIWAIVDRLTKSSHFIPFRVGQLTEALAEKYMHKIVKCMESLFVLSQIETLDLCRVSGIVFRGALAAS